MRSQLTAALARAEPGLPAAKELCATCVDVFSIDGAALSLVQQGASSGTYGSSGERSRRLDEYQFTFGEGPCLDAVASRRPVLAPDLDGPHERRWPAFAEAVLAEGIHSVFALPIMVTSHCVGALDLFRASPGSLRPVQFAGALLAAELAVAPLLDLIAVDTADGLDAGLGETGSDELIGMDRVEVYQATGMLMSHLDIGSTEALLRLRAHAIATGQTASQVAAAIIERRLMLDRDPRHEAGGENRE